MSTASPDAHHAKGEPQLKLLLSTSNLCEIGAGLPIQLLLPDFPQDADLLDLEGAILRSVEDAAPSAVVLSFGNVRFVTSRVLGVIISLRKRLLAQGRSLVLVAMDSDVRTLQTRPGDVVIFDSRIKHASYGGGSWRRVHDQLRPPIPQHKLGELARHARSVAHNWGNGHFYGEAMVRTAGPRRMRHLEQVIAAAPETVAERSRIASPARAVGE